MWIVKFTLWYGPESNRQSKAVSESFDDKLLMEDWIKENCKKSKNYTHYYTIQEKKDYGESTTG